VAPRILAKVTEKLDTTIAAGGKFNG